MHLFSTRMPGPHEWESFEPPDYTPLIIGWLFFLCAVLGGIFVDFLEGWWAIVLVVPLIAIAWLWHLQNSR
jgi:hypothetical protein